MTRFFRIAIFMALILSAKGAFAANWYVLKGATGSNNGTSWSSAWNEMSAINFSTVACGDTIWLGGGSYSTGINLAVTKNCTVGAPLTINRVLSTDAVPTAAAGWNASFDSQVIIPNIFVVGPAAYITINGREWQGGVVGSGGIQVLIPGSSGEGIDASNTGSTGPAIDHITWSYIEIYGPACVTSGTCTGGGIVGVQIMPYCSNQNRTNMLFDHLSVHRTGEAFRGCGWGSSTIQYSLIYDTNNDGEQHEDILYSNPPYENVTWRYNQIFMSPNDGIFFEGTGGDANFQFYGNVFYHSGGEFMVFKQETSGTYGPVFVYNNTFDSDGTFGDYSCPSNCPWLDFSGPMASGSVVENNIFSHVTISSGNAPGGNYNAWSTDVGKADAGANSFTFNAGTLGASSLLVSESPSNPTAANFQLTATGATTFQKGTTLPAPYNMDPLGNTRGANGIWYVGAYQYGSTSSSAPQPPTGLTVSVQ
jgi:hypothetical protein